MRRQGTTWAALVLGGLMLGAGVPAMGGLDQKGQDSAIELREGDQRVGALPAGENKALEALVIGVEGRVRWRENAESPFRALKVDDVLGAGAEVSTGIRSRATLRVGFNATIEIHGVSRVSLPEIVQDGDVLRTRAVVRRGRADFKVDKVGLANDFEVITPSTTLAVRGTQFSVNHGGLFGTTVDMFNPAEISAAEVRYFSRNMRAVMVRNGQQTSEGVANPVAMALFKTVGPPPDVSQNPDDGSGGLRQVAQDQRNPVTQGATAQRAVSAGTGNAKAQVLVGVPPTDDRFAPSGRVSQPGTTTGRPLPPGVSGDSFSGDREGQQVRRRAKQRRRGGGRRP